MKPLNYDDDGVDAKLVIILLKTRESCHRIANGVRTFSTKVTLLSSNRLTNFSFEEKQSTEYPGISTLTFTL